jgi:hypothetical protein
MEGRRQKAEGRMKMGKQNEEVFALETIGKLSSTQGMTELRQKVECFWPSPRNATN